MAYSLLVLFFLSRLNSVLSRPFHAQIVEELDSTYDFIIVGGGLSGLTVADRLSENPSTSVLVIEYGPLDKGGPQVLVPGLFPGMTDLINSPYLQFNLTSTPQPTLNNKTFEIPVASAVGGGTVINGVFFDRAAAADYDAWDELGATGWKFTDLLPYFRKACESENFTPAAEDHAKEFNISWDMSFHGHGGPIEASYPVYQFPSINNFIRGYHSLNIPTPKDPGSGDKEGVFWCPSTLDPRDQTRSYSRRGHYDRVIQSRPNYHILPETTVSKVLFEGKTAIGVEYIPNKAKADERKTVSARKEVILSAGSLHTPQILQLSGVGPSKLLGDMKINVVEDLPGVGQNFQDHPTIYTNFTFQFADGVPHTEMMFNDKTWRAEQLALYYEKRQGPFTIARDGGNVVAFLSLPTITSEWKTIVDMAKSQSLASVYSPTTHSSVLAGFKQQREILYRLLSSKTAPVQETGWNTNSVMPITLTKPFSRGTVNIQSTSILHQPAIDFGVLSDPTDLEMLVAIVEITRKMIASPPMQELKPTENVPGAKHKTKDELKAAIREQLNPTYVHPCCTASMMKKELGGVVDKELLVYGLKRLSVVDASVFPLIPATHPSATLYALSEKAADVIKARHGLLKPSV